MKRKTFVFILVLLFAVLPLFGNIRFGYGVSSFGETVKYNGTSDSFGGVSGSLVFNPSEVNLFKVEASALIAFKTPVFRGCDLRVSCPLFATTKHLFNRFSSNVVLWTPLMSAGVQYRPGHDVRYSFGLSPLCFSDSGWSYEFLSPYFSLDAHQNYGWGFTVVKLTSYFGGSR